MIDTQLFLEATLEATTEKTGREWEVTIIGARGDDSLVTVDGKEYVKSKNGRLYLVDALKESAPMWEGVKVYDNHMTQAEFEAKQGMRSPSNEWLGTIVQPRWDAAKRRLVGVFKVVEENLAKKLKSAYDQNVLSAIGLSIDTFPILGNDVMVENKRMPTIEGFRKILSVDLVGDPAAGGAFERIIAAKTNTRGVDMNEETKDEIRAIVAEMFEKQPEAVTEEGIKAIVAETLAEALQNTGDEPENDEPAEVPEVIAEAIQEAKLAKAELALVRALESAKLTAKHEEVVKGQFEGKVFEADDLNKLIKTLKEAEAEADPTGRVSENGNHRGNNMEVFDEADKRAMAFMYKLAGGNINKLDAHESDMVQERVQESAFYKSWVNNSRPDIRYNGRMSELVRDMLGGAWNLDDASYQEASTLATVIKNTVNIMTAVDYAGQNRWYEQIADIVESDNPIDDFTFARLFGTDNLDVVAKGAAYTEMTLDDEEETASHVKHGNYIPVHLEDLMADKIQYYRSLPSRLANSWYNTLSAKVAAVFTVNSAAGPVLSDTGALFNATAATTAGGHANLLTTALSYSAYDAVITAMLNQTDQPLGTGRKLTDMGQFYTLIPTGLRTTANQIANSELVPGQYGGATDAGEFQTQNQYGPNSGEMRMKPIIVPEWTDADNWAVVARYRGQSPIKLVFPMGMRTPQIFTSNSETEGAMFTNDTIRFKVRMMTYRYSATYDCAPVVDWRLLHKSNV